MSLCSHMFLADSTALLSRKFVSFRMQVNMLWSVHLNEAASIANRGERGAGMRVYINAALRGTGMRVYINVALRKCGTCMAVLSTSRP